MFKLYPPKVKAAARRLRVEKRQSLNEIEKKLGVPRSTLSLWLRDVPLTAKERRKRQFSHLAGNRYSAKDRGLQSKHYQASVVGALSREQKARIAEAAVLFRLALHGVETYGRVFDGQKADWVGITAGGKALRIQVRWAGQGKHGLPAASLRCSAGRKKYRPLHSRDFDFVAIYDLYTDTAYIFSAEELRGFRQSIAIRTEAAEAFWKLARVA